MRRSLLNSIRVDPRDAVLSNMPRKKKPKRPFLPSPTRNSKVVPFSSEKIGKKSPPRALLEQQLLVHRRVVAAVVVAVVEVEEAVAVLLRRLWLRPDVEGAEEVAAAVEEVVVEVDAVVMGVRLVNRLDCNSLWPTSPMTPVGKI